MRSTLTPSILLRPAFDPLRSDPRFQNLLCTALAYPGKIVRAKLLLTQSKKAPTRQDPNPYGWGGFLVSEVQHAVIRH
jgi:hypothetical protein